MLAEHPAVREVVVMGAEHDDLGQEVCAVVVPHDAGVDVGSLEAELHAHATESLAHYKVPSRWRIDPTPLPRNATGKVIRPRVTV